MSEPPQQNPSEWWGTFTIPLGRAGSFRIGSLAILVSRRVHEWQVARERVPDSHDDEVTVDVPVDSVKPKDTASITRYATASRSEKISLVPVLPDRPVVTRPERPLTILPRTHVTLYVGSPVWVRLVQGDDEMLGDLPLSPTKEAWVGPNTREGEFCYATRTYGRLVLDQAVLRPHRVMTAVTIRNEADAPFLCERFNLPVPRLSVYSSKGGRLWTEAITLERSSEAGFAKLLVEEGAPREATGPRCLSQPRVAADDGNMFRAFGAFFG